MARILKDNNTPATPKGRTTVTRALGGSKAKLSPAKRVALSGPVRSLIEFQRMERAKERLEEAHRRGFLFRHSNTSPTGWMIMAPKGQVVGTTYGKQLMQALRWKDNGWKTLKPGRKTGERQPQAKWPIKAVPAKPALSRAKPPMGYARAATAELSTNELAGVLLERLRKTPARDVISNRLRINLILNLAE